jgi:hypothetical protein
LANTAQKLVNALAYIPYRKVWAKRMLRGLCEKKVSLCGGVFVEEFGEEFVEEFVWEGFVWEGFVEQFVDEFVWEGFVVLVVVFGAVFAQVV